MMGGGAKVLVAAWMVVVAVLIAPGSGLYSGLDCNANLMNGGIQWTKFSDMFPSVSEGDYIEVPCGEAVQLDVPNLPPLRGLNITGFMVVPRRNGNFNIVSDWVLVQGRLIAGSAKEHFKKGSSLTITLAKATRGEELSYSREGNLMNFGTGAFAVVGGQVWMYGMPGGRKCEKKTWMKLASRIDAGSNVMMVDGDLTPCWERGHRIVVSSTSTNFREREVRTIASISSIMVESKLQTRILVDKMFEFEHTGLTERFQAGGEWISEAGEVGLLSRNVVITAERDPAEPLVGGHIVVHETQSAQHLHGVEIFHMGQQGVLGRYSTHFHMCENVKGSIFRSNSIHDSLQRGLVIHGTHELLAEYNVFSDIAGHGVLLEDHSEMGNIVRKNVGFYNDRPKQLINIDGEDESDNAPAMFWITNPANIFEDNIASGSIFAGFWFELSDSIRGVSKQRFTDLKDMNPRKEPLGVFQRNEAHSCNNHGVRTYPNGYEPIIPASFREIKTWKNQFGVFLHNSRHLSVEDSVLFDNRDLGIDFNEVTNCTLKDSLIVGKSPFGEGCPKYGAVRNSGVTWTHGWSGNQLVNVQLDHFKSCTEPLISQLVQEDHHGLLPASTAMFNVRALDRPAELFLIDEGFDSTDFRWRYSAVQVQGGNLVPGAGEGYVVSNLPIMKPPSGSGTSCSILSRRTAFCPGTCYRTVKFSFGTARGQQYNMRVTRLDADGNLSTSELMKPKTAGDSVDFYINLLSGYEYTVQVIRPSGVTPPTNMRFQYVDGVKACTGGVTLLFQHSHGVWDNRFWTENITTKPCPGSVTSAKEGTAFYFEKCVNGKQHRAVELPAKHLPEGKYAYIYMNYRKDADPLPNNVCNSPVTRCTAFEVESPWKYSESGREPSSFASRSFDDSQWTQSTGPFGYGHEDMNEQLRGEHRTYYFRKEFDLSGKLSCYQVTNAALQILYGDGFVIYVNGREIYRKYMPAGAVDSTTLATKWGIHWHYELNTVTQALSMLRSGNNVIAVEVHRHEQDHWSSLSMAFDMQFDLAIQNNCLKGF